MFAIRYGKVFVRGKHSACQCTRTKQCLSRRLSRRIKERGGDGEQRNERTSWRWPNKKGFSERELKRTEEQVGRKERTRSSRGERKEPRVIGKSEGNSEGEKQANEIQAGKSHWRYRECCGSWVLCVPSASRQSVLTKI